MKSSQKTLFRLYIAGVGAITTMVTARALDSAWKVATGNRPPSPDDPNVPLRHALMWTLASAAGIGLAQVLANRLAAQQWTRLTGAPAPSSSRTD